MPLINKLFLLKLLLFVGVFTGVLFGIHALQARRIPDALKRQAELATENGKSDSAIRHLRQYLEFRPDDNDAREELAVLVRERANGNDTTELLFLYDQILRRDPSRESIRREALKVCLRFGRYTDAESHAEELLKSFPDESDLWQKLAAAQAALQKSEAAVKSYESAIRSAPSDILAYQRYAQYLWRDLQQTNQAREVLNRLVENTPHLPDGYLSRAKFDSYQGDDWDAIPDIRRALEVAPENPDALLMLAEQLQKRRQIAAARDCLADGLALYPSDTRLVRALAWLELNRGSIGASIAALERGLEHVPDRVAAFDLMVPLADLLLQLGDTSRTEELIARLGSRSDKTGMMQVKYLQARLAMQNSDWPAAKGLLTELRSDAVGLPGLESQANLLLSNCLQRLGEHEAEQETLRVLLNRDPNHLGARLALAQTLLNAGAFAEAEREYNQAVRSPYASHQIHGTLVRLKAARLLESRSNSREWDQLEQVSNQLQKHFGNSLEPMLLRAELATLRGNPGKAVSMLRAEAARRPGDARVWAALADATATLAGVSIGLGVIDEGQASAGDGPDLRIARADLYARDPAQIRPIQPLAEQIDTWSDADQLRLLYGLLEVYDRLGDDEGVIRMSRRIASRRPSDIAIWQALGERAYSSGDTQAAEFARTNLLRIDDSGKSAALCDAWQALAGGQRAEHAAVAQSLVKQFGDQPVSTEACVTLARLRAELGESDAAKALFQRALTLEPARFTPARESLRYTLKTGDKEAASRLIQRLSRDPRWTEEPFRRLVRSTLPRLSEAESDMLLSLVRPWAEARTGGVAWLGDCYLSLSRFDDAVACYRESIQRQPVCPDDWLRLAILEARQSGSEAAGKVLERAAKELPPTLYLGLAATFVDSPYTPEGWKPELETPQQYRAFTQARLATKLSRYQRDQAAEILENYLEEENLPPGDATWARRNLAMLLVIRGGKADRNKAMSLLEMDADSEDDTPDEIRSSAAVLTALARYLDGEERRKVLNRATTLLTRLAKKTGTPRDAYLLAQVHRAKGDREASIAVMNQLLAQDPKNLEFHLFALEELMGIVPMPKEVAGQFAQRLLVEHPADFRAVAAVAKFECKAGQPERALALAEGYIRTADQNVGDMSAKSARVAELLDEMARLPEVRNSSVGKRMVSVAIERYQELATTRPEAVIAAAGLLGFTGQTEEAFRFVDRFAKGQSDRLRAAAGLAVLRGGEASEAQFARVQGWLESAIDEEPDSLNLILNQGELYALQQKYRQAEQAYETVLQQDPRNVIALNNMAWILAPQPDRADRAMEMVERAVAEVGLTGELLDTRARIRITSKQFEQAERDLHQALIQGKTPLRMFHLAMAKQAKSPDQADEARQTFKQALTRGLNPQLVHPQDLPIYRALEAAGAP